MNLVEQIFGIERLAEIRDVVALQWETGSCTYQQLAQRIQNASIHLKRRGVRTSQRVVFQCEDTVDFVSCYFAVINIGAVAIAVSTRLDEKELEFVIRDSAASLLVSDSLDLNSSQSGILDGQKHPDSIELDDLCAVHDKPQELQTVARNDKQEALWVYSSGSTSRPKGIVHTHGDILAGSAFHRHNLKVKQADLIFCSSKISFAYALANGLLAPLRLGATVYLHPEWITLDAIRLIVANQRPRIVFSVPSIYRNLLEHKRDSDAELFAIPSIYVSAGEHLPGEVRTRWQTLFSRDIINVYGCSETLFLALASNPYTTPLNCVGSLLPGVEGALTKGHGAKVDEPDHRGVLLLRHPFMFSHYANRVQDTSDRLREGCFDTGDLFHQDKQGNWYHLGRDDELLKVSGQWVYLRDIENVARDLEFALDAVVLSAKDADGLNRPGLFFIPVDEISPEDAISMMRRHIEQKLPMVKRPSWVRAVKCFPRTANGKISRSELRQIVEGCPRD